MALSRTWYDTLVDDDGSNLVGSVIDKADILALINASDAADAAEVTARNAAIAAGLLTLPIYGAFTPVVYAGGNFTGGGLQTWGVDSGDQLSFAYKKIDREMLVMAEIATSTVGGVADGTLRIAVPGGFTIARSTRNLFTYSNNGGALQVGMAFAQVGQTFIQFYRLDLSNWAAGVNNNSLYFQMLLETTT